MYTEGVAIITVVLFGVVLIAGFITWGFACFYMVKTNANSRLDRRWGKILPWSVFIPSFFTDEGNKYRVRLLKASGLFLLLVASAFALGFINESLRPTGANNKPAINESSPSSNPVFKKDNRSGFIGKESNDPDPRP